MFDRVSLPKTDPQAMAFGGRGTEYLLVVGLVIIIAGAVILTLYSPDTQKPLIIQFQCRACQHTFEPPVITERIPGPGSSGAQATQIAVLNCPSKTCQAAKSSLPMARCHQCEKYYLSETTTWRADWQAGKQVKATKPNNICPHCKTDQRKWSSIKRREEAGR